MAGSGGSRVGKDREQERRMVGSGEGRMASSGEGRMASSGEEWQAAAKEGWWAVAMDERTWVFEKENWAETMD
jgi:hypothetical protein